jgi:hypothetical protein
MALPENAGRLFLAANFETHAEPNLHNTAICSSARNCLANLGSVRNGGGATRVDTMSRSKMTQREEKIMRMMTKAIAAMGFVAATAVGGSTPTMAQALYLEGPDVSIGIGPRYHRYRYYDRPYLYDRPYAYRYHRWRDYDRWRYRSWDWD